MQGKDLELSVNYCKRNKSALNLVTEWQKCETSEKKEKEFTFEKPQLKEKISFVQGIGSILMHDVQEKQQMHLAEKSAKHRINMEQDTAFVQSAHSSDACSTWGSHAVLDNFDDSAHGIKKHKKKYAKAAVCSTEKMAIAPTPKQWGTTFVPAVIPQLDSHASTTTMHMNMRPRNVDNCINMPYGKIKQTDKYWDKFK